MAIKNYALIMEEGQRQLVLMALAHLAFERPGFDHALAQLAVQIDNESNGRPELYDEFKRLHRYGEEPTSIEISIESFLR